MWEDWKPFFTSQSNELDLDHNNNINTFPSSIETTEMSRLSVEIKANF